MRVIAILCILLLLPGLALAESQGRPLVPPMQFDWSATHQLEANHSIYNDARPVLRDDLGNFHIASFESVGIDAQMEYTILDPEGNVKSKVYPEIPGLSNIATPILVPEGLLIIWAVYDVPPQIDQMGEISIYAAVINEAGELLRYRELEYEIPGGTPGRQLEKFEMLWRIDGVMDSEGNIHVIFQAGDRTLFKVYYMRFSPDFELDYVTNAGYTSSPNNFIGGEIALDAQDNIYIIHGDREDVVLTKFTSQGERVFETIVGKHVFLIGGQPSSEYTQRGRGPVMAVEPDGTVHIAHNELVRSGLGREIVDIRYVQVKDGEEVLERRLTQGRLLARFPTITLVDDIITVTWEQPGRGVQSLHYTSLTTEGEPLFEYLPLAGDEGFASSGLVWVDSENHFTAFWWLGPGVSKTIAHKNTRDPITVTMWHRLGVIDDFSERAPIEQVLYWFAMVLTFAVVQVFSNLHVILAVILGLFILYKVQLLELLQDKHWLLLSAMILLSYILAGPMELTEMIVGSGYYFYSALGATILVVVSSLLLRVRYYSSLNLIFACLSWLFLVMVLQVLPVVPYLIQL